jgi:tRNA pseudouridine13 synthase
VLRRRVAEFDIHPTGPLWGEGPSPASGAVQRLESEVLAPYDAWRRGLEHFGLEHQRRSLRLPVRDMTWLRPDGKTLVISFWLPSGGYATAAVRELVGVRS